jgi:predicted ATPase
VRADLEAWVDRDLQTLAEVARRLDGLPLALELAAGRSPGGNLDRLLDVVATPLDLVADELDREPRHQSLREAIGWSIERLTSKERRALARLSVFVATFARGAAVAVIASPEADVQLRALVRGNLVHAAHTARGQGLRLLTAVRDAAREVLRRPRRTRVALSAGTGSGTRHGGVGRS